MGRWTAEQVLALAPDANSIKSGQDLSNPRKWVSLGCSETALWGECQGSGKNPYQAQIDLTEPAFKCSCPSRKFPCKHALGLFLLFVNESNLFTPATPPEWVSDWLSSRSKRAEQKAAKAEAAAPDPVSQAKRAASREAKVDAGLQELDLWLCDLVRGGLAGAQARPTSFWENMAARMVDAQAPGIARFIRNCVSVIHSGEGWQERLLKQLSKLYLLVDAYSRIESLPELVQADIRSLIGWTQDQGELLQNQGIRDHWLVLGQQVENDNRLKVQRTWLYGSHCHQTAQILHFTPISQPMLDTSLISGTSIDAELVFYPSQYPQRALIKTRGESSAFSMPDWAEPTLDAALQKVAMALARNPWLTEFPMMLDHAQLVRQGDRWFVRDSTGDCVPVMPSYSRVWNLLALSGGAPVRLFGEWDGEWFLPLMLWKPDSSPVNESRQINSSSPALWHEMVAQALVGVERSSADKLSGDGSLAQTLKQIQQSSPERRFLAGAAVASIYQAAGHLPKNSSEPIPAPCPLDDKACPGLNSNFYLNMMLQGQCDNVLPEYLLAVAEKQMRVPDESLPDLLDYAKSKVGLWDLVSGVLGKRGEWLAAQNPEWNYVLSIDSDETWQTGTRIERSRYLTQLRAKDPDRARELLISTWNDESPTDRMLFVQALGTNLSMADEPFLESVLDDRRKDVRRYAARLLLELPQSRLVLRMIERVKPFISFSPGQKGRFLIGGRKASLEVKLPDEYSKEMDHDGVESKPHYGIGQKAWWLVQIIGSVPPDYWITAWQTTPAEIVQAFSGHEWEMALLEGFTDAAQRHHHYQWVDALLPFSLKPPVDCPIDTSSLLASVCSEDREALILKYMNSDRVLFSAVDCEHRWSVHLSRSILQQLKRDLDKKRYKESNLIQLFYYFAPHLAPSTYPEAAALLPKIDAATNRSSIRNEAALNSLKLRHDMLEAI